MPDHCFLCGFLPKTSLVSKKDFEILMCPRCRLGFLKEIMDHPLHLYEGIHYYDAWWRDKAKEEEEVRRLKDKTSAWVLDQMKKWVKPGARLLDVGCAFGYFLESARKRGYQVKGLEISKAYQEARQRGFEVFNQPLENLNLPDGSFDAVIFIDVFEHLSDPEVALEKCRHLVEKKEGVLVFFTPNVDSIFRHLLGAHWLHFKLEHLYYYSKTSLVKLLDKHGFEVVCAHTARKGTSLRYVSALSRKFENMPDVLNNLLYRLPFSTKPFMVRMELFCIARIKSSPI